MRHLIGSFACMTSLLILQSCGTQVGVVTFTNTETGQEKYGVMSYNDNTCGVGTFMPDAVNTGVLPIDSNGDVQEDNAGLCAGQDFCNGTYDEDTDEIALVADFGDGTGWMAAIEPPLNK